MNTSESPAIRQWPATRGESIGAGEVAYTGADSVIVSGAAPLAIVLAGSLASLVGGGGAAVGGLAGGGVTAGDEPEGVEEGALEDPVVGELDGFGVEDGEVLVEGDVLADWDVLVEGGEGVVCAVAAVALVAGAMTHMPIAATAAATAVEARSIISRSPSRCMVCRLVHGLDGRVGSIHAI